MIQLKKLLLNEGPGDLWTLTKHQDLVKTIFSKKTIGENDADCQDLCTKLGGAKEAAETITGALASADALSVVIKPMLPEPKKNSAGKVVPLSYKKSRLYAIFNAMGISRKIEKNKKGKTIPNIWTIVSAVKKLCTKIGVVVIDDVSS